jgi:hypothetical protein
MMCMYDCTRGACRPCTCCHATPWSEGPRIVTDTCPSVSPRVCVPRHVSCSCAVTATAALTTLETWTCCCDLQGCAQGLADGGNIVVSAGCAVPQCASPTGVPSCSLARTFPSVVAPVIPPQVTRAGDGKILDFGDAQVRTWKCWVQGQPSA